MKKTVAQIFIGKRKNAEEKSSALFLKTS